MIEPAAQGGSVGPESIHVLRFPEVAGHLFDIPFMMDSFRFPVDRVQRGGMG